MTNANTKTKAVITSSLATMAILAMFVLEGSSHKALADIFRQEAKLTGAGANVDGGGAKLGQSVAVSADGSTVIAGGYRDDDYRGAAWVFVRSGGVWTQQGNKLTGTDALGPHPHQGNSVAISADGNTVIFGGPFERTVSEDSQINSGAAWVFRRSGGAWTQDGVKLVGTGAEGWAAQGHSAALSADGKTAVIGGPEDSGKMGAVWVFVRSGGVWTQQGSKLVGTGATGPARQGASVAISADGNTVIVGGPSDDKHDQGSRGAALVFTRNDGVWTQQDKLFGTGGVGWPGQGTSVGLSADGNTAIVGGFTDTFAFGAAWVFTRSGEVWTQQGNKLRGTGAIGSPRQGVSVALSAGGNTAIIGGRFDNEGIGAAWVFTRSGEVWVQDDKLIGTNAEVSQQGTSVGLSADGKTAVVGGPKDFQPEETTLGGSGAVWVYSAPPPAPPPPAVPPPEPCYWAGRAFSHGAVFCIAPERAITCEDGLWSTKRFAPCDRASVIDAK